MNEAVHADPCYSVRLLEEADAPAVRRLFHQVFGKAMSPGLWHWKYGHPDGHAVGVFRAGELVAHYGGLGRSILCKGERSRAVQIVDVMVSPAERGSVRRNSPFFLAGKAFLERHIGYGKPYLLGFGFPSDRHMRLARLLGLYAPVGKMVETSWSATDFRRPLHIAATALRRGNVHRHERSLDRVWRRLALDLEHRVAGLRDAAFIRHRYLDHPDRDYDLRLLYHRISRQPLGLVVLRHDEEHSLLLDAIGALEHLPLLLQCAGARTREVGNRHLKTWCSSPFATLFRTPRASQHRLPITTPTNIWTPGPDPAEIREKWWLMAGDTDFQ